MVSILSIDGGGIRGIIPAAILAEIEKRTRKPVCELFDYIAGTSTGGIIAAMLATPGDKGNPMFTAEQVKSMYIELGSNVFHSSFIRKILTLGGILGTRYSSRRLEKYLKEYLKGTRLHSTLTKLIVPSYDTESCSPWFFKTTKALRYKGTLDDPELSSVVRATTAAPTFFPPLKLDGHCFIDGGVVTNNPSLCAYAEARKLNPKDEIIIVSLGTGRLLEFHKYSEIKNWGALNWAIPIFNVLSNSSSTTVDYQMKTLLGKDHYFRFEFILDRQAERMDDASKKNIQYLESVARKVLAENTGNIETICKLLC